MTPFRIVERLRSNRLHKKFVDVTVYLDWLQSVPDSVGNKRLAEARHAVEASEALDGHDAWQDRDSDATGTTLLDPVQKQGSIVEQLGDNEIGALVHFELEPPEILFLIGRVQVSLRISGHFCRIGLKTRGAEKVS